MNIIILAGGVGKRLWPVGRQNKPKQFFPIFGQKPLVKETYDRFIGAYGSEKIFFSTSADLLPHLKRIFPRVPASQFIVEPSQRDTGPAMGYAAAVLALKNPDEPMAFIPSDHFIADQKKYLRCFKVAEKLIKNTGKMVDIGIMAAFPSTVLGYTKIGRKYGTFQGAEIYHFAGHTEKPDLATAEKYLASGSYLWHGNYYMWTPRRFLLAFKLYAPSMYDGLEKILDSLAQERKKGSGDEGAKKIKKTYEKMEKVSFDYLVTEKIEKSEVLIIRGDFGWSDIGAWDVLHHQLKSQADEQGNVVKGAVATRDTRNCLLYGRRKKLIAALGLEDTIIVDTEDAVLVCPRARAQEVKKLLEEMEKKGMGKYL